MKTLFTFLAMTFFTFYIAAMVVRGDIIDDKKKAAKINSQSLVLQEEVPFHKCIHDSAMIQNLIKKAMKSTNHLIEEKSNISLRNFEKQEKQNIRIVASYEDLYVSGHYCSRVGESVQDFDTGSIKCSSEDDILTQNKRDLIINKIMPAALNLIKRALMVEPSGKITVPHGTCQPFTVPSSHSTTGVSNADYVLYVASAPTSGNTVAFAGACGFNNKGKPVLGLTNIGTKFLKWDRYDPIKNHNLIRTTAHEILHALGFSSPLFQTKKLISTETRRGKTVTYFKSPTVVQKAREYFGCNTMNGPEIEDEGGQGTGGSHVERRNHFDDIMAGVTNNMMFLSPITLAVMEDLGYYEVDWSKAETPNWMRNIGCGAGSSLCNTPEGGKDKYFCFEKDELKCTFDRISIGYCPVGKYTSSIPSYFQYFTDRTVGGTTSLTDYCPVITGYSNTRCTESSSQSNPGDRFGPSSRCYETSGIRKKDSSDFFESNVGKKSRCLETLCNNSVVYFRLQGNDDWVRCTDGTIIDVSKYGYTGTVTCPAAKDVCASIFDFSYTYGKGFVTYRIDSIKMLYFFFSSFFFVLFGTTALSINSLN